jgi:protein SCO1/2
MKIVVLASALVAMTAAGAAPKPEPASLARNAVFETGSDTAPRFGSPPPPGIGGPVDLVDDRGERFTNARLQGRPALVFFGLTHCGITCPVALATAKQLLAAASVMRAPAVVFVTLDPLNDDAAALHRFLSNFDQRLIGLTGTPSQIEGIASDFGVGTRSVDGRLEHSSMWYLMDGRGRVRRVYGINTPAAQLASDVERLGKEDSGDMR